jgi:hypothetical protein
MGGGLRGGAGRNCFAIRCGYCDATYNRPATSWGPFKLREKFDQYVRKAYVARDYCVRNPRDPETPECDIDKTHH